MKGPSTEELKRAIAAIFLGEGTEKMKEEHMLTAISLKRRWFPPDMAKNLIENGKKRGLLKEQGVFLEPTFDYRNIEIPFGYFPPKSVAEAVDEVETLRTILRRKLELSDEELKEALSMDYNLCDDVKILLWAALHDRDYLSLIDAAEKEIFGL
jgi:hypothetical protein